MQPGSSVPQRGNTIALVLALFPDVREDYIAELVEENDDVNAVCNLLLEDPACPRRETEQVPTSSTLVESVATPAQATEDPFDYSKLSKVDGKDMEQALYLLMDDFRMLCRHDITWALRALKGHYALTRKALSEALTKWQESANPSKKRQQSGRSPHNGFLDFQFEHGSVKFNRRMRLREKRRPILGNRRRRLEASVHRELRQWEEHEGFQLALRVNEDEYKKEGQLIECGCCYGEFAFEKMTQCSDAHLFCKECLVRYAQEAVFGSGQSELSCMKGGCTCSYPVHELEKVLPEKILCKYYERRAEEAVAAAYGDKIVRCPFCNFPALLDNDVTVFSCPNRQCLKESCKKCQVRWKDHVGKTCEQVEQVDETRTRVLFEERMTATWVRKCVKCRAGLVKTQGCNHMQCRCGSHMCYVCRKQINGRVDTHFCRCACRHQDQVDGICRNCGKCSQSVTLRKNDEQIIKRLKDEGEAELNKSPHNSRKRVGPPLHLPAKKVARR